MFLARRLTDVEAVAISLYARGLTTGEISAHFAEVRRRHVTKDTVWRITGKPAQSPRLLLVTGTIARVAALRWAIREMARAYPWMPHPAMAPSTTSDRYECPRKASRR